jgi:sulfide:quinone oxidoreductase
MNIMKVDEQVTVSAQVSVEDLAALKDQGVELIVCNRPDGEAAEQLSYEQLAAAARAKGIEVESMPFKSGEMPSDYIDEFASLLKTGKRIHAYCRTGNRSFNLYSAAVAKSGKPQSEILAIAKTVGFDVAAVIAPYFKEAGATVAPDVVSTRGGVKPTYDVVIVGAGSGGIAAASSLLKRNSKLRIAIIDPAEEHFYQPGWTMVGGGIFDAPSTRRQMKDLIPKGVTWVRQEASGFLPSANEVQLDNGESIHYDQLIVAPGLILDWAGIGGLQENLGKNGVTSNYSYKTAPYTWDLVRNLKHGKALFTQPAMPIKCAGAPQKAVYLSCDHWQKAGVLKAIDVSFFNAGGVLFGVKDYVPALQSYMDDYGVSLQFSQNLVSIDGEQKVAYFKKAGEEGGDLIGKEFEMIHVCPPQRAPACVATSELADAAGWLDVDQYSLQHKKYSNIWGLGDVMNAPNAKTMAAVRKQVPVVAQNIFDAMAGKELHSGYDGYGSCPLTVENGKIVLAEFGYGGKLLPSFPSWMLQGTKPTRAAWVLKKSILPGIYWHAMLKGHEWLAAPKDLQKVKS